jgi:hypothetical protein
VGINVIGKAVQMDDTHQKRVNTDPAHNPTSEEIDGMIVRYIFTRKKSHDNDGDGNPLIYAADVPSEGDGTGTRHHDHDRGRAERA